MEQQFDPITLIFLIIAGVIIFRIWSLLGTKTGNEDRGDRIVQPRQADDPTSQKNNDNVIPLPDSPHSRGQLHFDKDKDDQEEAIAKHSDKRPELEPGFYAIVERDSSFNPDKFIEGAKKAYEMIVEAFANGDRKTLKSFLSPDVFTGFESVLKDRENKKISVQQEFIGVSGAEILEAGMDGSSANVTIKFGSTLINAIRNDDGEVIEGSPDEIKQVTDIWTFSRDTNSTDPNWILVATGQSA